MTYADSRWHDRGQPLAMQAPQRRQLPAADLPKKAADLPQLFDVACRVAPRLCAYDEPRPRTLRRDQLYMYAPGSVLATSYMYYTMYSRYSVGRVLPNAQWSFRLSL